MNEAFQCVGKCSTPQKIFVSQSNPDFLCQQVFARLGLKRLFEDVFLKSYAQPLGTDINP